MQLQKADYHRTLNSPSIWQDIKGYEGLYKISYNGIVYSVRTDKYLSPGFTKATGYLSVVLVNEQRDKSTYYIHRLVGEHHVSNPENKPLINHKYGYKLNNHKDIIEWATFKENNNHAISWGLRKVKLTPELIASIVSEHVKGDKDKGAKALAMKYNLNKSTIHEILNKYKYASTN